MTHEIALQIVVFPNPLAPAMMITSASRSTSMRSATPPKPTIVILLSLIFFLVLLIASTADLEERLDYRNSSFVRTK